MLKKLEINFSITFFLLFLSFVLINAAPSLPQRQFSCMSYQEDDRSLQDDDVDEYSTNPIPFDNENEVQIDSSGAEDETLNSNNPLPHRRICPSDYTFCFSLWRQTQNGSRIEKQGCWKESTERNATCSQKECTSSAPTARNIALYYCCCSGDVCNQNVSVVEPTTLQLSKEIVPNSSNLLNQTQQGSFKPLVNLMAILIIVLCIIIIIIASVYHGCSIKEKPMPEEAPLAPSGPGYSSNLRNVDNINLICMLGRGKYGTVMKGLLHDQEVAVKIFPESHYEYYINERNIYSLPLMDCNSLLSYFGYDERNTSEGKIEYQLVLSLAPLGCLQDWLIVNTMDFETFCCMVKSINRGLSYLHTEIRRGDEFKPCIVHRDLNSRNVLVKTDRTCVIADFGFALKVFRSKYEYKGEMAMAETKSINEVGTLRYMAPELLEGAVNLRDCATSFTQMDVYALGLVLWEVATRCTDFYSHAQRTPTYKAPYELEVGAHPTFDQMQALVVRRKARPLFPTGWGGGRAAKLVKDTCEDCWDHDAEARLTALCAEERMQELSLLRPRSLSHAQAASPVLNTNNLSCTNTDGNYVQQMRNPTSASTPNYTDTTSLLYPSPNKQIVPENTTSIGVDSESTFGNAIQTEKNHLTYPQQQLQPYQGRNPCQERNLAPITMRQPRVLVEKSKKHSFQTGQENSFSCLEDDVSVEDLISGGNTKKFSVFTNDASSMGQGFPKQHNTDKKLRGWHGVRALIHKRLFRKDIGGNDVFRQLGGVHADEKSNLVDTRTIHVVGMQTTQAMDNIAKSSTIHFVDSKQNGGSSSSTVMNVNLTKTTALDGNNIYPHNRRPNNLDLSPIASHGGFTANGECNKSNIIHTIAEETNGNFNDSNISSSNSTKPLLSSLESRTSTPAHLVPRSLSTNVIKYINNNSGHNNINSNNNNNNNDNDCSNESSKKNSSDLINNDDATSSSSSSGNSDRHLRRQRSLEVFREVFSNRGSTEHLRNPSQRVKTPGHIPPSVRKIRASKTLSLYDDRMMDSSILNIL